MKNGTIAESNNALINNIQNDTYRMIRDAGRIALIVFLALFGWYWYAVAHGTNAAMGDIDLINSGSLFTWLTMTWVIAGTWVLPSTWVTGADNL